MGKTRRLVRKVRKSLRIKKGKKSLRKGIRKTMRKITMRRRSKKIRGGGENYDRIYNELKDTYTCSIDDERELDELQNNLTRLRLSEDEEDRKTASNLYDEYGAKTKICIEKIPSRRKDFKEKLEFFENPSHSFKKHSRASHHSK